MSRIREAILAAMVVLIPAGVGAAVLQSPHFRLAPNVAGAFGGGSSSTDYKLQDMGGEAVVGAGSSTDYKLTQGYDSQLDHSIQLNILPSGITAYYPLDSAAGGSAYDVSVTQNNGILKGSPSWVGGKIGNGLSFNGSTDYVTTTTATTGPTTFSLEAWLKTGTVSGGRILGFGNNQTGNSTSFDRQIYMGNNGKLFFGDGSNQVASSTAAYNDNAFHHVAATISASGMNLYVDGTKVGTNANTSSGSYSGYWRIGDDALTGWPSAPTSNFFSGTVDEVKIFNRELSAQEVFNDYAAGAAGLRQAFTIPNVTPGQSQTYTSSAIVRTDAGGYNLSLMQNHNLLHTDGSTTIAPVSGNVTAPAAWTEGTTKGLGFTLTGGTSIDPKWGSNPNYNYAAIPSLLTNFYSRTGFTTGLPEQTSIQYRVDVAPSQKNGTYSNTVIYTATLKP